MAVYRGDVVITQGTLKITGDTVTITQNAQGELEVFTSVGKPAYYEQKPAVDKQIVKAYGMTIQYFAANERIVLIDQAKVIQEGNTFEGEKIVYDTQRQIVNAGRATGTNVGTRAHASTWSSSRRRKSSKRDKHSNGDPQSPAPGEELQEPPGGT